jgi:pimeloyl-ACP methyl ester carboxylesterase
MKKVLYLHGLESKQGGSKVEYLTQTSSVFAPQMDYSNPQLAIVLEMMYQQFQPDVIIGSSMGGYAASYIASKYPVDVILLNPVTKTQLPSGVQKLDFLLDLSGERKVILSVGYADDVVDPFETFKAMVDFPNVNIIRGTHSHRTPLNVFTNIYDSYIFNEF